IFSAVPAFIIDVASFTALESTFGQAQSSFPTSSYSTMPSLMLLALTALTCEGLIDFANMASLTQCDMSSQFLLVSKACEPGTPSRGGWVHSCCAMDTC